MVLTVGCARAADLPPAGGHFVVVAHRGEHQSHHENTLEAIAGAITARADYVELDIRRSRDGQHLLMHDSTVDRMTGGHGRVADLSWEELKALAVRDTRLTNIPPSRIPLFSEALAACRGGINLYLDFKDGDRAEVASMIRSGGMAGHVVVYDGGEGVIRWRAIAPALPIITSPPGGSARNLAAFEAFLERVHPEVLDQGDTAEMVQVALRHHTAVWPDIQSRDEGPAYWERALARGIVGAQSDHPVEFVQWLEGSGRRKAPAAAQ